MHSKLAQDIGTVRFRGLDTDAEPDGWQGSVPARTLIVDDNLTARTTVRSLLDWHGFQVCGEAKDGKEAVERVIELKPDIVVLDINLPVMDGIQAASEIRRIFPEAKILFLTIHEAPELIARLHPLAHGFISKSAAGTELIPALTRIVQTTTIQKKAKKQSS
jgi:DNA-binding NarL/FixJ family response regulator